MSEISRRPDKNEQPPKQVDYTEILAHKKRRALDNQAREIGAGKRRVTSELAENFAHETRSSVRPTYEQVALILNDIPDQEREDPTRYLVTWN